MSISFNKALNVKINNIKGIYKHNLKASIKKYLTPALHREFMRINRPSFQKTNKGVFEKNNEVTIVSKIRSEFNIDMMFEFFENLEYTALSYLSSTLPNELVKLYDLLNNFKPILKHYPIKYIIRECRNPLLNYEGYGNIGSYSNLKREIVYGHYKKDISPFEAFAHEFAHHLSESCFPLKDWLELCKIAGFKIISKKCLKDIHAYTKDGLFSLTRNKVWGVLRDHTVYVYSDKNTTYDNPIIKDGKKNTSLESLPSKDYRYTDILEMVAVDLMSYILYPNEFRKGLKSLNEKGHPESKILNKEMELFDKYFSQYVI